MTITISPEELAERIRFAKRTTLLAAFWRPDPQHDGFDSFQAEHIPSSIFCDPALSLAGVPSSTDGRNPLPDASTLEYWFDRWGINSDRQIVVYDEGSGLFASRAWWILTWAGVKNVRILDGGMKAWADCGYPVVGGPGNLPLSSNVTPVIGQLPVVDIQDVKEAMEKGNRIIIDCRSRNRFAGRKESLDLKAGHIPGSVDVPVRELVNRTCYRPTCNEFRSPEEIREIFAKAGITSGENTIIVSGSGIHSAQAIAAMHIAGLEGAALYPGGWSQWCADPSNPVERGDVFSVHTDK